MSSCSLKGHHHKSSKDKQPAPLLPTNQQPTKSSTIPSGTAATFPRQLHYEQQQPPQQQPQQQQQQQQQQHSVHIISHESDDVAAVRAAVLRHILPQSRGVVPERWDDKVQYILEHLRTSNGTFDDVDYNDYDGRSWWKTSIHLQRCLILGISYHTPYSAHQGNATVYGALVKAFTAWLKADFKNSNWWWMDIGVPRIVGKVLLLLSPADATALYPLATPLLDRGPLSRAYGMTGCNRVWIASVNVLRALTEGNATRLAAAYEAASSAIVVAPSQQSDGIQRDNSFHQHGPQLYLGWGYGSILSANALLLTSYAEGTRFAVANSTWGVLASLVLDGQRLVVRGPNVDYTTSGRLMTYFALNDTFGVNEGHYHYFAAFTDFRLSFPTFSSPLRTPLSVVFAPLLSEVNDTRPRAAEFHAFAHDIYTSDDKFDGAGGGGGDCCCGGDGVGAKSTAAATSPTSQLSLSWHFYDSDYVVHHRPTFFASVRMFSNRTINTECVNSENLRGRDLADAVLNVYVTGREYENVFPVWQWHRIPGTTEHQTGTPYSCSDARSVQHTSFVGGVTDRTFSVAAINFTRGHAVTMHVSKMHVFVDGAVIVLLGGLTSDAPYPITTSLDQSNLRSDVVVGELDDDGGGGRGNVGGNVGDGGGATKGSHLRQQQHRQHTLPAGTNTTLQGPTWLWHGNIGYLLSLPEQHQKQQQQQKQKQQQQHKQQQQQIQQHVPALRASPPSPSSSLEVVVSTKNQTGSWANITQGPPTPLTRAVFNAFINHGVVAGQNATSMSYAILPAVTSASDMWHRRISNMDVHMNTHDNSRCVALGH
ncbi:hypothetical protein PTSG_09797 [Salpingoeca rosetta]|uniref:Polysaccharide lyase family 8 central domain-containing protein n=1 Tax=Salpingoeca rosetta (strain ATCC 50818 / BSB-021) TaxID=946362 RepID=F2UP32_SALR5|nr:uncharacterized protein PTSG_09797 [Salpingoeca rosetta]EGD79387.1 hypothetical protein PTSG_09797 [Salpingoeca rosetta]|eukprot:XP_004989156.1 hypothetical protein PTSG_09797 [Salpingoeca rosetta]